MSCDCIKCGMIRQSRAEKPLIYIAQPYGGKPENLELAYTYLRRLQTDKPGNAYISPVISYSAAYDSVDYDTGIRRCLELLSHCNEIWIIGDDGESKGVKIEREYALKNWIETYEYRDIDCAVKGIATV